MAVLTAASSRVAGAVAPRMQRLLFAAIGFGSIAFTALIAGALVEQWPHVPSWYGVAFVIVGSVVPASFVVTAFLVPLPLLRAIATAVALAFLALHAAWPLVQEPGAMHWGGAPWPQQLIAVSTTLAAATWRPRFAWAYVAVSAVVCALVRAAVYSSEPTLLGVLDGANALLISAILAGIPIALRSAAAREDRAIGEALAEVAHAGAVRAGFREQSRIDGLVHDDVLTTLLYASRGVGGPEIREQAAVAVERIAELEAAPVEEPAVGDDEVAATLVRLVRTAAPGAVVELSATGGAVPSDVAGAVHQATLEALRNSMRHAGAGASRRVSVAITAERLAVVIADDGRGFDPARVDGSSVGMRVSIVERMRSVPGGDAVIRSAPGEGTTVELLWVPS